MKRMHLAVMNVEGDWQTACGTATQRVTERLRDVDCKPCLRWFAKHSPSHSEGTER